jgi:hypothetical protein
VRSRSHRGATLARRGTLGSPAERDRLLFDRDHAHGLPPRIGAWTCPGETPCEMRDAFASIPLDWKALSPGWQSVSPRRLRQLRGG